MTWNDKESPWITVDRFCFVFVVLATDEHLFKFMYIKYTYILYVHIINYTISLMYICKIKASSIFLFFLKQALIRLFCIFLPIMETDVCVMNNSCKNILYLSVLLGNNENFEILYMKWMDGCLSDIIYGPHDKPNYFPNVVFVRIKCYSGLGLTGWKEILGKVLGRMPKTPLLAKLLQRMQS